MICYVDLEHPELGPSMLSEGPQAIQRKSDLLTFKARFEAMRHGSRPLYGVQFHPERYSELHPDGRAILANFFRLAASATAPRSEAAALARA